MRLLIVTQTVDTQDPVLGFFHTWIAEFAKHCERVTVVCLNEGEHTLPPNVRVLSLGKEDVIPPPLTKGRDGVGSHGTTHGESSSYHLPPTTYNLFTRLRFLARFYSHIWCERKNYDTVFVHMNQVYVVFGGPLWRLLGKQIVLWSAHGSVPRTLRIAVHFAHLIFTASKESFRIPSNKVHVVGHGIDVAMFTVPTTYNLQPTTPPASSHVPYNLPPTTYNLRLVAVGRISKTKRQDLAIGALAKLREQGVDATLTLIGAPLTEPDRAYETTLRALIREHALDEHVVWAGGVPNGELPACLGQADIMIHTSQTGSLDKVVLEALAAGVLLVTTSDPIRVILPPELAEVGYSNPTPEAIAESIVALTKYPDAIGLRALGRTYVETQHALPALIERILGILNACKRK